MRNAWNILPFILLLILSVSPADSFSQEKLLQGCEVLVKEKIGLVEGKNIALITNSTAVTTEGMHIADYFVANGLNVVKIFTPEHGFGADDTYKTSVSEIPVVSLYGSRKSFSKEDLSGIDILIYDIQDLGARYYTYISTLYLTMKDAFAFGTDYLVCDRTSVANLNYVSGFMLEQDFSSFVGTVSVPVMYGMTAGELSLYLKSILGEGNLEVIPVKGYSRNNFYQELNLPWIKPSPNIPVLESAVLYPALCFLEGVNVSEGRATEYPFQQFGAPFIDSDELLIQINSLGLKGVEFTKTLFTPSREFNVSVYPSKYMEVECRGLKLKVTDFNAFKPVETNIAILCALRKTSPEMKWVSGYFIDKLAGTDKLRKMIDSGYSYEEIIASWSEEVNDFRKIRENFLLYK